MAGIQGILYKAFLKAFKNGRLEVALLTVTVIFAFLIRLLPLKWDGYLSGFESYWYYYVAEHLIDYGASWIFQPQGWVDWHFWYPYGRDVAATTFLGLPLTLTALHGVFKGLGLNLLQLSLFFPPASASLTVILAYLFGRELGGGKVGLLAALFTALCPIYVNHTVAGFLEPSTLGLFLLLLVSFLFIKALKADGLRKILSYSTAAGLVFAYLNVSWDFCYYAGLLLGGFVFAQVALKKYSRKLAITYLVTVSIGIALASPFPTPGLLIVASTPALPILLAVILLLVYEASGRLLKPEILRLALSLGLTAVGGLALYYSGFASALASECLEALNPAVRTSTLGGLLKEASLDYRIGTWASNYIAFGGTLPFAVFGLLLAAKRRMPIDIYLVIFLLTSLYASASMVRLSLLAVPALSLLAAYAVVEILRLAGRILRGWKAGKTGSIWKLAILLPAIIVILLSTSFINAIESADLPPAIATSAIPGKTLRADWLEALGWIRGNLEGKPIVAWWTHGYWLALYGKAVTVADPSLLNSQRAAMVGVLLLSNETEAEKILRSFNAQYVLVFITTIKHPQTGVHVPSGFGDDGSWLWMAKAASQLQPEINVKNVDENGDGIPDKDTLLGKVILYAMGILKEEDFEKFKLAYVSPSHQKIHEELETAQIIILKVKG